jgi:signal transduction histidine kinase
LKTHQELLDAILHRGLDPESDLRRIMSPDISGAGSAKHEVYNNIEEYITKIFKVEIRQMPNNIEVLYQKPRILIFENLAVLFGLSEARFMLNGTASIIYKRRTVVYIWIADRWLAIHLHASHPSNQISEGESWPTEALKARNEELKKLVDEKTLKLTLSIEELKTSQTKLIQSEKMASLGELTAGIAHEIQNPLNFVNNFSEVNTELIEDLKGERSKVKDERNEQLEDEILNDLENNLQKIAHHGKRADAIVKGMLQHSRSNTSKKEPTDINKLADEYLRLCYHGLRAKDPFFNATIQTDFDQSLEEINIIPQDIGRVFLNLFTNAFYAVTEKKKSPLSPKGVRRTEQDNYEPVVTVTTKSLSSPSGDGGKGIEIRVRDNGNGIPQKILDKIFQPFFTTKPTGQGTGLGLSLSYDIIKGHGGELKVETKEGGFAEFIIHLPR